MKVLFIGSHPDDLEIYCAGTIMRLSDFEVDVSLLVLTSGKKNKKVRVKESGEAWEVLGVDGFIGDKFKSGYLKHDLELVSYIDKHIRNYKPNVVVSHCLEDYHQDHRAVALSVRSALRGRDISWITYPFHEKFVNFPYNFVVDISDCFEEKKEMLDCFKSQKGKWYMKQAKKNKFERFKIERVVWKGL